MWQRDNQWDIVSPDRQVPAVTNLKYVVINLQTHDCNQDNHQVATGHVVELAWKLFDDAGTTLETKQYLLKPYGGYKQISESATSMVLLRRAPTSLVVIPILFLMNLSKQFNKFLKMALSLHMIWM